jgi:predicted nucleic acid-binding protein
MNILLDSSVFVAFFNKNDFFHKNTVQFIHNLSENNDVIVVLPVLVFLEVANSLSKHSVSYNSEELFDIFDRYEKFDLDYKTAKDLTLIFKRVNLKTSDAVILGSAILNNATLITWDEKLAKQAKKFTVAQTPKKFQQSISSN